MQRFQPKNSQNHRKTGEKQRFFSAKPPVLPGFNAKNTLKTAKKQPVFDRF
jgi:hypothetical protein